MGRKYVPIKIVVHGPTTAEAQKELERKVAEVHGDMAAQQITKLHCTVEQKSNLLRAILDASARG